ncbi:MAG: tyrosine-type recombinase/integrase [Planctomycetaceae bacterium]|nr:tyrosine-type recombinase/integrase [Planctomycetaceae bacterium]
MPKSKLTDAFVKSAKPLNGKLTEYADTKETGLCLRVTATGEKSWTYRYRLKSGKQKRMSLGKLRDTALAKARELVVINRAKVANDGDPATEKFDARLLAKNELDRETVKDIGNWYFRECEAGRHRPNIKNPKRQSTIDHERYFFTTHIVPAFGKTKLSTIKRASIQAFVDNVADDYSPSTSRQCRIILHGIIAFAQRNEITSNNPCQYVTTATQQARERVLSNTELSTIWDALTLPIAIEGATVSAGVAYATKIAMVTLQRRGEVTGMRIDELDIENKIWVIPSHRTKNHHTHVVPLSDLALELIEKAIDLSGNDTFVFPSPRNAESSINPRAMTRAFARMRKPLGLKDARPHDFRRTGATNLTGERLGFPRFTVSKVLNHASDTGNSAAVTSVYDRNEYLPEKRRALDAWAIRLLEIVEDRESAGNVVNLGFK